MAWAKKSSNVSFFHVRSNVASFSQFFKIVNNFSRFSTLNNMVLNMCSILVCKLWMPRTWHAKKIRFGNLDLSLFNHVKSNLQSSRFTSKWRNNVSSFFNTPYKISSFEVIIPKMWSFLIWFVSLRGVVTIGF